MFRPASHLIAIVFLTAFFTSSAQAEGTRLSPSLQGTPGLNTVPSARMDESGTVRFSLSTLDPYLHGTLGMQIADPLYIALRQSAETSRLQGTADRLLPGIDLRLRLVREGAYRPEMTIGLQSAVGHKRMAGEYLALSKRYNDFDFTAGMGWGRFGSRGSAPNLFDFDRGRRDDGNTPSGPDNWFAGQDLGFFAGIQYDTPIDGLSLKADWSGDDFSAEKRIAGFDPPDPWSIGFALTPTKWLSLGAALVGGEKIMGTLSLQRPLRNWFAKSYKNEDTKTPFRSYRTGLASAQEMENEAARENIGLYDAGIANASAWAEMEAVPEKPLPRQIGRAARAMANHAGEDAEELQITASYFGLKGPSVRLMRRDLEQAIAQQQGSPDEIWRNAAFDPPAPDGKQAVPFWQDVRNNLSRAGSRGLRLALETDASLSEEDSGFLYRTAIVAEEWQKLTRHWMVGAGLRLNLKDNLNHLHETRPRAILPVRSDIDDFTETRLSLDRSFIGWMTTIKTDLHIAAAAGYLEEMYSGIGGEILYRPFGQTFAIGADAWQVFKRDPFTAMNMGLNGDHVLTAHLNAWYEFPGTDLTLQAQVGRYLAADTGGSLSLTRRFNNGAQAGAFITATNSADLDPFGDITHVYSGLNFKLPLGSIKHVPEGTEARFRFAQIGRDSGQALNAPLPLYDLTEPLSYRRMAAQWETVTE